MLSVLLPSRNRPESVKRLVESIQATAANSDNIEIIVRLDDDEPQREAYLEIGSVRFIFGPRDVLSKYWNECYEVATGPIYMHCGDDIIFQTPDWDEMIEAAFGECEDKILFVHGRDGIHDAAFGTHGFLHKAWVDAVGYFVPPYFSSDYNDTWLNDVANVLGRRLFLPFYTEHMHFVNGKGPYDLTHQERMARHATDRVDDLYQSADMVSRRQGDVDKLRAVIGV